MDEPSRPPQILVVDDDQDTVAILARHLEREGFVPIEANSGAQCLKMVHENEVDVILLDLMMPEMDGFELVAALQANAAWRDIPVVVVTALDLTAEDRRRLNGGVDQILSKHAFPPAELITRVGALLGEVRKVQK
jgi:CheY-like chemotaxis protein